MGQQPCACPTCRRIRELASKRARAQQLLEGAEGFLSLNIFDATGGASTITIESGDQDGLEAAIETLEDEIESARDRISTFGHGRRRRRWLRSSFMERR